MGLTALNGRHGSKFDEFGTLTRGSVPRDRRLRVTTASPREGPARKARPDAITWLSPPVSMKGKIAKRLNSAAFRPQARRTGVLATACLRRSGRHQRLDPLREPGFAERALRLEQLRHFDHELVHVRILCG